MKNELRTLLQNIAFVLLNFAGANKPGISFRNEVVKAKESMYEEITRLLHKYDYEGIDDLGYEELDALGFRLWDEPDPKHMTVLMLVPVWLWDYIPEGTKLYTVLGVEVVKDKDKENTFLDFRHGSASVGFKVEVTINLSNA